LLRQLRGREVRLIALTHVHPDHQGLASVLCRHYRVPLACHEADVPAMEGRRPMEPNTPWSWPAATFMAGPPHPVERVLRDGDDPGPGWRVVHPPGHPSGHVLSFRPGDRLVIAGDVLRNLNFVTLQPELAEPPALFTVDPALNRASIRRLL